MGSSTAIALMVVLTAASAKTDAGDCLAVWVDTQGQAAECTAVRMSQELRGQRNVCAAPSAEKAVVRVKLTYCRQQVVAAIFPPGSPVGGREYVIRAEVAEGKVTKQLSGLDRNSWAGAVQALCRAIAVWHGDPDRFR